MAINMQGSWTVAVKSKSAVFPQRFVIADADSGNGTYEGATSTAPVYVTGDVWSISIQSNPGSGWVDSDEQIKFPTSSGGQYRFDIESNDPGPDQDFNDLVLTCSMPITESDFLVYGNASYYSDGCINPCFKYWVVIETELALTEALRKPALRKPIEMLYPDRVRPRPPFPEPHPDPPPFRPIIIPLHDKTAIPPRQAQVLRLTGAEQAKPAAQQAKHKDADELPPTAAALAVVRRDEVHSEALVAFDRVAAASIVDRWVPFCETGPLPGVVLRFQEYDRTAAELAGGSYTGAGVRENLGVCATDRNGNYIFRFSRSISDIATEIAVDAPPGEDIVVQAMPDLIAQLLDPMATAGYTYESSPYWNVPLLKRIDLCIPKGSLGGGLKPCNEGLIIQAIGDIFIGEEKPDGSRVGFNNSLNTSGQITARNTMGPQTRCSAWRGILNFYACLEHNDIAYYTIRYKRPAESTWKFFQQEVRHPLTSKVGNPGYNGDLVGPHDIPLKVDGGPKVPVKAYHNIENQAGWVETHIRRKARIYSWQYEGAQPGPVQFRIEGYRANGNKFAGADDIITLFLDNTRPDLVIDENITMDSQTLGNCALFTLPESDPGAALTIAFKADHPQGFLKSYTLYMNKGATGGFPIQEAGSTPPWCSQSYVHGDDLACSQLQGTFDDPTVDPITGFVTLDIEPQGGGSWLEETQTFCAFGVRLTAMVRATNGHDAEWGPFHATPVLIGIEKA